MKKIQKIFPSKRRAPLLAKTDVHEDQSTSNLIHAAPTTRPFGCEILFEGTTPIVADVVFVHGLHGHRRNTWTKDNICWPKDLLPKEESLSRIRILTFGYDANIVNLNGRVSLNNLFDHSLNLLYELSRERKNDTRDRPIIFVAHSLGGIILKDALNYSDNVGRTQPHLANISSVTRGIVFLGTPHRGTGMTSLSKVVACVAQVALRNTNVNLIRDLERESQTLDRIRDSFSRILDKRTLTVWSFVEELATNGIGKVVVDRDSAIIGDARECRETIHADHFGIAKFSTRDDPGYRKVLNAIEMVLERPSVDDPPSTNEPVKKDTTFYDIPRIRAFHFVVRHTLLTRLEELFDRSTTALSRSIVVLFGMGGVGKTQLTIEYCLRMKNSGKFQVILWLDASSRNSLYRSMEIIAKRLFPGRVFDNPDDAVTSVNETLSSWSYPWLMVVDNFDDPSELQDILQVLPDSQYGSILITSRYAGSKELGQSIEVDCMDKSEGLQLLLQSSENDPEELSVAEDILERLGYLPLAIDQARAYISKRQLRLRDFLCEFEKRKKDIMNETPQFWHYHHTLPDNKKISLSLLTTWEMSLPLLGVGVAGELRDVLTLFSFFHPFSISENIFKFDDESATPTSPMSDFDDNEHWDHLKFESAISQMQELSLVRFSHRGTNELVVSLHTMVSEWLRMRLDESTRFSFFTTAISHLENYVDSTQHDDYTAQQETLSHIDTICQAAELHMKSSSFPRACSIFAVFYHHHGRLEDAERMYCHALSGKEKEFGPDHTSTLGTVNNLGLLYSDQGRLEDAERMYSRALSGYEKALGPDHMSTLETVNNFGNLYRDQGQLEDAEKMYSRALSGKEKELGPDHASTLRTVNNLGILYCDQERFEDAEKMYRRALSGKEKALGPEHTSTLDTVNNLGVFYRHQGLLKDAEKMYDRALSGYEKALGPDHTSTLDTVTNLGNVYKDQGHLDDAERMYIRALSGKEKALGPGHTSTLTTANNLVRLYTTQGRLEDAERIRNRMQLVVSKATSFA